MNSSRTAIHSIAAGALPLAGLLVLAHLCWHHLQTDPPPQKLLRQMIALDPSACPAPFDKLTNNATAGNLLLEFKRSSHTNEVTDKLVTYYYFRANYILYPRRLYCAPPTHVINKAGELLQANFHPDEDWQQQHHIAGTWIFDFDKSSIEPYPATGGVR